ncbi:MAG: CHASE4 domain-containing protein [Desulfobacterales bacterium]|jgi:signal transduction histidine kinase|nr:CHASE4 domain-containing protein [Desulfobacterales bacterium]
MTLKWKIAGSLLVLSLLLAVSDYTIYRRVIYPNYLALEQTFAKKELARCIATLESSIKFLDILTNDWAAWDDSYAFLLDRNADYIKSNLVQETFLDNDLNLIHYYDLKGNLVWGKAVAVDSATPILIRPLDRPGLPITHSLLKQAQAIGGVSGLFLTDKGPMLVSSRPVITSENRGPAVGTLIMGKLLSPALVKRLVSQTRVDHTYMKLGDAWMTDDDRLAMTRMNASHPMFIQEKTGTLQAYTTIPDIDGVPALLLRATLSRDFTAEGLAGIRYGAVSDILVSIILVLVLLWLLKMTVIGPIASLTRHAVAIRDTDDLTLTHNSSRKDEIGVLSREFDRLVARQHSIQKGLMGEIEERQRYEKKLTDYHRRLRHLSSELLLTEERERRKIAIDLHDYIGQPLAISKIKLDELASTLPAATGALTHVEQIGKYIETAIQSTRTLTFDLSPPILYEFGLAAALKWLSEKFGRQYGLEIKFDVVNSDIPVETALRVMLFQAARELLFNIIKHARSREAQITMMAEEDTVKVMIQDNGVGFDPEAVNVELGFGLFSIKERIHHFGGRFELDSAPGKGTRVCLTVPLKYIPPDAQRSPSL